jgi:hypothetical protein
LKKRSSFYGFIAIMVIWIAAACVLLTPIKGMEPVEDETATSPIDTSNTGLSPRPIRVEATNAPTALPELKIVPQALDENANSAELVISAWYPRIEGGGDLAGVQGFNQYSQTTLQGDLAAFQGNLVDAPDVNGALNTNTYLNGYQVAAATTSLVSLELDVSTYNAGAAHPLPYTITLNYDLDKAVPVRLADLFKPGSDYLGKIATLAKADLESRGMLFFEEGVQPNEDNYRNWTVSDAGLTIIFDVYQVAAYAAGAQRVTIPFADLSDILAPASLEGLSAPAISLDHAQLPIQMPQATLTPQD